jgi:hypothetical protein
MEPVHVVEQMMMMKEDEAPKRKFSWPDVAAKFLDLKKFCFMYIMLFVILGLLIFDKFDPKVKNEVLALALDIVNYTFALTKNNTRNKELN